MTVRGLFALALALSAGACRKSSSEPPPPQSEEELKRDAFLAKAEANALARLEGKLMTLEGLKLPGPVAYDGAELDTEWTSAWWVNAESLASIASEPKGIVTDDVTASYKCFKLIRHPDFGKRSISEMGACERGHYAFVIRTQHRQKPVITDYGKPGQMGEFKPGTAHGDVVVFDLSTGQHVGGFRWSAKSADVSQKLNLERDFERALVDGVRQAELRFVKHR